MKKACIACHNEFNGEITRCPEDGSILTPLVDDTLVGVVLADKYEILKIIGGGGMGVVYMARHRLIDRIAAIKVLHRHLVSSADALKRFQFEAQAASRLNAPNVLSIYDFGLAADGRPYMVMDLLEGQTLTNLLELEGHLGVPRSLNIFIQACAGLFHAHSKGVLHRDLKPSNIMLTPVQEQPEFVKILDFGIAKLINQGDKPGVHLTKTGEIFGSPLYMSPEQCRGRALDARSDIYALGSLMYRTLTGVPLFSDGVPAEVLFKQVADQPANFSEVAPDLRIPPELEAIVLKALKKDPDERYQSMSELGIALQHLRSTLPDPKRSMQLSPMASAASGSAQSSVVVTAPHTVPSIGEPISPVVINSRSLAFDKARNETARVGQELVQNSHEDLHEISGPIYFSNTTDSNEALPGVNKSDSLVVDREPVGLKPKIHLTKKLLALALTLLFGIAAGIFAAFHFGSQSTSQQAIGDKGVQIDHDGQAATAQANSTAASEVSDDTAQLTDKKITHHHRSHSSVAFPHHRRAYSY